MTSLNPAPTCYHRLRQSQFRSSLSERRVSYHPFDSLMELPTEFIQLDCAALHLAKDEYPHVNVPGCLAQLDQIAAEVSERRPGLSAVLRYEALRDVLVDVYEFTGDEEDYYDPQNCYLNAVLERRVGLPITLSTIWIEVGRRLNWPVFGVGMPGHFMVRVDDPERFVLIDPFHAGRSLSVEDCKRLLEFRFEGQVEFSASFLAPVDTRTIVVRMLNNLKRIYLANNDLERVERVLHRLAAAEPENGSHLQDLASVHCRRGDVRGAYAHLALYLTRLPNAEDGGVVKRNLQRLEAALRARN
jgi:regulator of sirC expression with transglutaminase-like and TPR domain